MMVLGIYGMSEWNGLLDLGLCNKSSRHRFSEEYFTMEPSFYLFFFFFFFVL